jgi:hypothetical protein
MKQKSPRILMTAKSDAQEYTLERIGGREIMTICHFSGLWYEDSSTTNLVEHYKDISTLAKIVAEEQSNVVVFSGCSSPNLPLSTILAGKFLLRNTGVKYVVFLSAKKLERHNDDWFSGNIFELNHLGLSVCRSYEKITVDDFFDEVIKIAKYLNKISTT